MSASPEKPSFRQIYREQYQKDSASKTTRAFQFITPAVFLIVALFSRHSPVVLIILGVLAALLIAGAIVWSRRQRRTAGNDAGPTAARDVNR
jgi:Flp pilus assembly protein TadB